MLSSSISYIKRSILLVPKVGQLKNDIHKKLYRLNENVEVDV